MVGPPVGQLGDAWQVDRLERAQHGHPTDQLLERHRALRGPFGGDAVGHPLVGELGAPPPVVHAVHVGPVDGGEGPDLGERLGDAGRHLVRRPVHEHRRGPRVDRSSKARRWRRASRVWRWSSAGRSTTGTKSTRGWPRERPHLPVAAVGVTEADAVAVVAQLVGRSIAASTSSSCSGSRYVRAGWPTRVRGIEADQLADGRARVADAAVGPDRDYLVSLGHLHEQLVEHGHGRVERRRWHRCSDLPASDLPASGWDLGLNGRAAALSSSRRSSITPLPSIVENPISFSGADPAAPEQLDGRARAGRRGGTRTAGRGPERMTDHPTARR